MGSVEIFYNDTADTVSKRVADSSAVEMRGNSVWGVDVNTKRAFIIPLNRIVRIEGGDPLAIRRIFAGIPTTIAVIGKEKGDE